MSAPDSVIIEELDGAASSAAVPVLADVLMDCVEGGASVGFVSPLTRERAEGFWTRIAGAVRDGDRALLVARENGGVVGTVQLVLALPENQPHRAEVSKLLVSRRARRRGIAESLMRAAEARAEAAGRDVLVLDTATPEAARLYERLGWASAGTIPEYALYPDGSRCATTFYWKKLATNPA